MTLLVVDNFTKGGVMGKKNLAQMRRGHHAFARAAVESIYPFKTDRGDNYA